MRCCRRSRASTETLGADRGALRTALASLRLETPTGPVHLDGNRQAVVPATLVRLTGTKPGPASFEPVRRISAVDETLGGLLRRELLAHGALERVLARHAAALGALSQVASGWIVQVNRVS